MYHFACVEILVKDFMETSLTLLPLTTCDKCSQPIIKAVRVGASVSAPLFAAVAAAAELLRLVFAIDLASKLYFTLCMHYGLVECAAESIHLLVAADHIRKTIECQ
jgi:hypothetical protein